MTGWILIPWVAAASRATAGDGRGRRERGKRRVEARNELIGSHGGSSDAREAHGAEDFVDELGDGAAGAFVRHALDEAL